MKTPGSEEGYELTFAPEGPVVEVAPEAEPQSPAEWVRKNLFPNPRSGVLTVVLAAAAIWVVYATASFVFGAADWSVLKRNLRSFMTGRFPLDEMWRVWTCVYTLALLAGLSRGATTRGRATTRRIIWRVVVLAAYVGVLLYLVESTLVIGLATAPVLVLVAGNLLGRLLGPALRRPLFIAWLLLFPFVVLILRALDGVKAELWGGFMLNVLVAVVAIFVSFPIGILLALGRRSTLPAVRVFSVGVIEFIRGCPLAVLIFVAIYVFPLLLPPGPDPSNIVLAMAIFVIFSTVYVAEIVRGGLQGVPDGQYEAANALGLRYPRMMRTVVLPQALRNTIPAMISHFISLFKDTSLLVVVGLFEDLASRASDATTAFEFVGREMEALLPAAFVFWVVAFSMSRWSQRVETRVGVGER
ncbi:MAG: amino acid ABC transporter permease [Actinomycetota bacterium]